MSKGKLKLEKAPIWDRQPGETAMQFMWFTRYKDARLNGESMTDVCKKYEKRERYAKVLHNWSGPNQWTARIEAYRDFLDQEQQKQRLRDIQEMGQRQALNGVLLQQYALAFLQSHPDMGQTLTPEMAVRFMEAGAKMERTARGAPTEIRADAELPEETRKRMESIYAESMSDAGKPEPAEFLEQEDIIETDETERG